MSTPTPWPTVALVAAGALTIGLGVWLYRRRESGKELNLFIWVAVLFSPTTAYAAIHSLSGMGVGPGCLFMPPVSIAVIAVIANWQKGAGIRGNLLSGRDGGGYSGGWDGGDFDDGDGGDGGDGGFD